MDIKQVVNAQAVLTLGKDMTFRDFAQGAFRMRGIGKGLTIVLFVVPVVARLVTTQVCLGSGEAAEQRQRRMSTLAGDARTAQILKDIAAWLVLNAMRSEKMQWNLLCEQSVSNVWRKRAYRTLIGHYASVGTQSAPAELGTSIELFRERVDFTVENTVPKPTSFTDKLAALVSKRSAFIDGEGRAVIEEAWLDIKRTAADGRVTYFDV